jgi:XTP/dITP diphosphohydrolase
MFVPDDYDETFGEMTSEEKQKISHRANAFKQLIKACF